MVDGLSALSLEHSPQHPSPSICIHTPQIEPPALRPQPSRLVRSGSMYISQAQESLRVISITIQAHMSPVSQALAAAKTRKTSWQPTKAQTRHSLSLRYSIPHFNMTEAAPNPARHNPRTPSRTPPLSMRALSKWKTGRNTTSVTQADRPAACAS